MAFDYKKEYKEFYMPKGTPSIENELYSGKGKRQSK